MMDFRSLPFVANATPAGRDPSYLAASYTAATGSSTAITRPAGATAGDMLCAFVFATSPNPDPATSSPPSGWTAGTGLAVAGGAGEGARAFFAAGDVSALTFDTTGAAAVYCFAVSGASSYTHALAGTYYGDSPGPNFPAPPITAATGDLVASLYVQASGGAGSGVIDGSGFEAGYTRSEFENTTEPRYSLLTLPSAPAGSTGDIDHAANDSNYATRFGLTVAFSA
jgi:hypothetical protein